MIAVNVPPLRDRRDDIPLLVDHFLARFREKNGKAVSGCTRAALDVLTEHDWPGNVRELENAIERAVVLTKASVIDVEDLPREVRGAPPLQSGSGRALTFEIGTPLDEIEMRVIHETLRHTKATSGWRRSCSASPRARSIASSNRRRRRSVERSRRRRWRSDNLAMRKLRFLSSK